MSRHTYTRTRKILAAYGTLHTQGHMPYLSHILVYEQPYTSEWYLTGFDSDDAFHIYNVVYAEGPGTHSGISFEKL